MAINIYRLAFPAQQHVMNTELELPFNELYTLANTVLGRANQTQAGLDKLKDIFAEDKVATFDVDAYHNDLSLLDQKVQAFHEKFANSYSTPEAQREFQSLAREIQMDHARKANLYRQSYEAEQSYLNAKKESDKWGKYYNTFQSDLGYNEQSKRGTFKKNEDGTYDYENPQVYNYTPYTHYADINQQIEEYVKDKKPSGYYKETPDGLFIVGQGQEGVYQKDLLQHLLNNRGAFFGTKAGDNLRNMVMTNLYQDLGRMPTEDEAKDALTEAYNTYANNAAYEYSHQSSKYHLKGNDSFAAGIAQRDLKGVAPISDIGAIVNSDATTWNDLQTYIKDYEKNDGAARAAIYKDFIALKNQLESMSENDPRYASLKAQMTAKENEINQIDAKAAVNRAKYEDAVETTARNMFPNYNAVKALMDSGRPLNWSSMSEDEKNGAAAIWAQYNTRTVNKGTQQHPNYVLEGISIEEAKSQLNQLGTLDKPTVEKLKAFVRDKSEDNASANYNPNKNYTGTIWTTDRTVVGGTSEEELMLNTLMGSANQKWYDVDGTEQKANMDLVRANGEARNLRIMDEPNGNGYAAFVDINVGTKQKPDWKPFYTKIDPSNTNIIERQGTYLYKKGMQGLREGDPSSQAMLESADKMIDYNLLNQTKGYQHGTNPRPILLPNENGEVSTFGKYQAIDRPGQKTLYRVDFADGKPREMETPSGSVIFQSYIEGVDRAAVLRSLRAVSNAENEERLLKNKNNN